LTKLTFLGACKTIGGSANLIETNNTAVLLDYGAYFNGHPTFPTFSPPKNLVVALSHAHLDHSGGLPFLFGSGSFPVYMTAITRDLIRVLLKDMLRLSDYFLPFEKIEIDRLFRRIKLVDYDQPVELKHGVTLTFLDAGHIPGSAVILVETPDNQILYTGDVNTIDTQLQKGARLPKSTPDTVILESTYALTAHEPRKKIEEGFINTIREVIDDNGIVLVPAFAVARAQEILAILTKYKISCPIYLDGMAREVSRIFLRNPSFFRSYSLLSRALRNTEWIQSKSQRSRILKHPSVIVAPAGMLRGGTAALYMSKLMNDPKHAVLLVGFQILGTPGRELIDNGFYDYGNGPEKVKAKFQLFDFSSHAGQKQLIDIGRNYSKCTNLFTVHGEAAACSFLADTLREKYNVNASIADLEQTVEL
jgi:putative mRNA 3-end processing factor